ncbi:MAG: hypothetical protein N4A35_11390 [Flavobacteriales bacterium]|jgi:hypothetical protein|nr:hypothetical protein [Flavobacteriales bacterium]
MIKSILKNIAFYTVSLFVIFSSCNKREPNIYIFDDDLFDVSIDLPFNWKLVDGDHDDFCIVGWCKKDSSSNNYLNVYFDKTKVNKGEKPIAFDYFVSDPLLIRKNEKLVSAKILESERKHFFIQATTLKKNNKQHLIIFSETVIYDRVSVIVKYFVEINENSNINKLLKEVEHSITSVKAVNIKSSRGFLHHWS